MIAIDAPDFETAQANMKVRIDGTTWVLFWDAILLLSVFVLIFCIRRLYAAQKGKKFRYLNFNYKLGIVCAIITSVLAILLVWLN